MQALKRVRARCGNSARRVGPVVFLGLVAVLALAPLLVAQDAPPVQAPQTVSATPAASGVDSSAISGPIAIIPLDNRNPDAAAKVTGALEVSQGKAVIAASGSVTSGT